MMMYVLRPAGKKCLAEEIALYFSLINFSCTCVWSCIFLFHVIIVLESLTAKITNFFVTVSIWGKNWKNATLHVLRQKPNQHRYIETYIIINIYFMKMDRKWIIESNMKNLKTSNMQKISWNIWLNVHL